MFLSQPSPSQIPITAPQLPPHPHALPLTFFPARFVNSERVAWSSVSSVFTLPDPWKTLSEHSQRTCWWSSCLCSLPGSTCSSRTSICLGVSYSQTLHPWKCTHCGAHLQSALRRYKEEDQVFKVNLGYVGNSKPALVCLRKQKQNQDKENKERTKDLGYKVLLHIVFVTRPQELSAYPETVLNPSSLWSVVSLKSPVIQSLKPCPVSLPWWSYGLATL